MTRTNIALDRLHSQQLEQTRLKRPDEVVAWLGAMQSQDYAGAKWSIGLRVPDQTEAAIEQALAANTFIRTWAVRGTLHFVAAADVYWLLALVAPRIIAGNARRYRELELDQPTLTRSNKLLSRALQGGRQLTRTELLAVLERHGISTKGQRAPHLLQRASLEGLICQGVTRRNNPTYLSLAEALPEVKTLGPAEAVAELARRYFTSRSPATLQDFVWWSGLPITTARAGLEAIQPQLVQEIVAGQTYYGLSHSQPAPPRRSAAAYLLPGFDEYLLSYKDRSASLDVPHFNKQTPTNGMLPSTIVIAGRVVGTWQRTFSKGTVVIASSPFTPLTTAQSRAFAAAARRYGQFLSLPVVLA